MQSDGDQQGDNNSDFFPARMLCICERMYSDFESSKAASLTENIFLEKIGYR